MPQLVLDSASGATETTRAFSARRLRLPRLSTQPARVRNERRMRRERRVPAPAVGLPPAPLVEPAGARVRFEHPQIGTGAARFVEEVDGLVVQIAGETASPFVRKDEEAVDPADSERDHAGDSAAALADEDATGGTRERLAPPLAERLALERVHLGREDVRERGERRGPLNVEQDVSFVLPRGSDPDTLPEHLGHTCEDRRALA